jgi:hypothetical protein
VKRYFLNILIAIDQFINTIVGGDPDETISSRVGKRRDNREVFWAKVVDKIFFWQENHTIESIEVDEGKDGVL